jgi:hypothetical protein
MESFVLAFSPSGNLGNPDGYGHDPGVDGAEDDRQWLYQM